MSQDKPGANIRRRVSPLSTPESAPTSAPSGSDAQASDASARFSETTQVQFGNRIVADALGGSEFDGLGATLVTEMALASAGVAGQADQLGSNVAFRRVMRDAMHLDASDKRAVDNISRSGGRALPDNQLARMNAAFEHDFSHVRIHVGGAAAQASAALNAHAFTLGADVYFGAGEYAPGTQKGDRLLAHELTHVVQHDEGRLPGATSSEGDVEVSNPNESVELEAYGNENRILSILERVDRELEAQRAQGDQPLLDADAQAQTEEPSVDTEVSAVEAEESAEIETTELVEPAAELDTPESVTEPMIEAQPSEDLGAQDAPATDLDTPAMADRDHATPASGEAIERIKKSRGQKLPGAVAQRLGALLGHDFGHVKIHTGSDAAKAADDLNARAFALGADVFFGAGEFAPHTAEGQELLAHELTHVVQHDEGRLPTASDEGMSVSSPTDAAEVEARENANAAMDQVAEVGGFEMIAEAPAPSAEAHASTDVEAAPAMREAQQQTERNRNQDPDGGQGAGSDQLQVRFGGRTFNLQLPSVPGPGETLRWSPEEISIPGLKGSPEFSVTFGQDGMPTRGEVVASFEFAGFTLDDVTLSMSADGTVAGGADTTIEIPGLGEATASVSFNPNGVSVDGHLTAQDVNIPGVDWLSFEAGEVSFQGDPGGISAQGMLEGTVDGIGGFSLEVAFSDGEVTGSFTLTVQEDGFALSDVAAVESGTLSGSFSSEGMQLDGNVHVNVQDFCSADVDVRYTMPDNLLDATITLNQFPDSFNLGPNVEVSNTVVEVVIQANELTSVTGSATYRYAETWCGELQLTYDAQANTVSGTGNLMITEQKLGDGGVQLGGQEGGPMLTEAHANVLIEESRFVSATGTFRVEVPYEDEPTFLIESSELTYLFEDSTLSGNMTASTMRPLTLGNPESAHISIESGASATGMLANNAIQRVDGGLDFIAKDPIGDFGAGSLTFEMPEGSSALNAEAEFTLTDDYGFPDRTNEAAYFKEGGAVTITMTEGSLDTATVENLGFAIIDAETGGRIDGSVEGSLEFETGDVDASGSASITERWPLEVGFGELALEQGGSITGEVKDSELTKLDGQFPFSGSVDSETTQSPIAFEGNLTGNFDKEEGELTAAAEATLSAPVVIPLDNGDQIQVTDGNVDAQFSGSEGLTALTFGANAQYDRGGEPFLLGRVEEGTYNVDDGTLSFAATLILQSPVERTNDEGTFTFRALEGSEVQVEITRNALTHVGGTLQFEVDDVDGLLLKGSVTEASLDLSEEPLLSGTLDVRTAREFVHPRSGEGEDESIAEGFQFVVEEESGVRGTITENEVDTVEAGLTFRVDLMEQELARGDVNGTWNLGDDLFTGGGGVALTRDFPLITTQSDGEQGQAPPEPSGEGAGRFESYTAFLATGSGVEVRMVDNALEKAQVNAEGYLNRGPEQVATATLSGEYKLGDEEEGFSGDVNGAITARIPWSEGERFNSFIDEGSTFSASMTKSAIDAASGTFLFSLDENGTKMVQIELGADYTAGEGISADGTVNVIEDILVHDAGDGWQLFLAAGSGGSGSIVNDELTRIGGEIILMLRKDGEDAVRGAFSAEYLASEGQDANITGTGTVEVLAPIEMGEVNGYTFTLVGGSGVTCQITNSDLDYIEGTVTVDVGDTEGDFLQATLGGKYTHGQTDFSGTGSLQVTDERQMAQSGLYQLMIVEGGGAQIEIAAMQLVSLSATIPMRIDDPEELIGIKLTGTYIHADENFSGSGEATLLRREAVAEDVPAGDDKYSFYLEEGTGITATVADNDFTEATGTLNATVADQESDFLSASANGTYTRGDTESTISADGGVTITREKLLVEGDEYNVSLVEGSGATFQVVDNQVEQLGGTIHTRVDRIGGEGEMGEFATVDLEGTWTRAEGFNGRGSAELVTEFVAGVIGNYTLVVEPGAGAEVELVGSTVTRIGGTIPVRLDEGELQFIRGQLTGDYVVQTEAFSGSGAAEVLNEKQLASLGDETLWLNPGTGAQVNIENNVLTSISGQVFLSLRDTSEYVEVQFGGNFDAAGGTGFTGGGSATVTRDKKLAEIGDYSFWLEPGAGAEADVHQNALTRVGGNVPFRVNDNEGPLLRGQAEGEYLAETGLFSGSGRVELARNLTFDAPGGITLEFLTGSGGGGEVVDNELRRLEGTLKVNIGNADGPLIYLEANGAFDAVNKNIEHLEGTMRMLRPFELLDGAIIIEGVNGTARVEDNELKEASGGGTIRIPDLNDMTGTFNVNYSNQGGEEKYWGDGTINFTLFDEPDKGRYMRGEISAEYNRDDTFSVSGDAEYAMNEMISGTVGVEMDQTFDPNINATLSIDETLVPGKELFRKEMDLIPRTEVPIYGPIALFFGAKGGMGLEMLPLNMTATIGVSNWRPLAEEANVPDFDAELALNWGMNFDALVAAYMSLGLTVGVASVSAGIRGEVALDVPLTINPVGRLHGGSDGYWGELGIGLSIDPSLSLRVIPFVDAAIRGMDPFTHDFDGLEMTLDNIASFEWGTNYIFGDREEQQSHAPEAVDSAGSTNQNTATTHEEEPQMGGDSEQTAQAPGGPGVSGSDVEGEEESGGQDGAMAELMETIDKIQVMAEGIGALGELVGLVISLVTAFLTFGPVGLIVMAVWKVFTGELSWDNIVEKIDAVVLAFETAWEFLEPYMPEWLTPIIDAFSGEKPGLLDALFGADDAMRESVGKGEHRYANTEFRATMINEMMSGWCGGEDEACIAEVLEFSDSKGDFSSVVRQCEGGADRIMDKLGGSADTRVGRLMHKNGISYSTGW